LSLANSGIVKDVQVDVGSEVKKDEILLSLDNKEEEALLDGAKASLEAAKVEFEFAKAQYERYQKSRAVFDANTFDKVKLEYEAKEKALLSSKSSVAVHAVRLSKTILKAPFDGVIAEKNVEIGDGVMLSGKALFRLISRDSKLVLSFDSKFASVVKVRQSFKYKIDEKESECKIYKIYPSANAQNRKLSAECDGGRLMSGLFGDGNIKAE